MTDATTNTAPTTFAGLWEAFRTAALNAVQAIKAEFVTAEAKAVPVIQADAILFFDQLKGVAVNIATTLATQEFQNLTGTQKNKITIASIKGAAIAAGKPLLDQDATMLAQQGYYAVQEAIAAAAAPAH